MKQISAACTGLLILLCCILGGCAPTSQTSTGAHSGFLLNYPSFQPGLPGGVDQVYTKPGMDLSRYRRVMVDEVQFYLKQGAAAQGIQASELRELADTCHKSLFAALGNVYPLVTEPGPDVLRIRLALTDIETSNPARNAISTVLPVGLAVSVVRKAATGSYTGVGGASMEVEFLDSMTGERLAAAIDTFNGSKMSGFSKLGATEEAFAFWAKRLRVTLDRAHGKSVQ